MLQKLCNNLLEATVVGRLLRRLLITDHIYGRYKPNPDNESHSRKSPNFSKRGLRFSSVKYSGEYDRGASGFPISFELDKIDHIVMVYVYLSL